MADNRTSQLLPASFKGVSFSVRSESSSEIGRKLILHEYVNSSERFIEDQGQIPPRFSVRAFVHGADFIARAERFEQALNERGPGQLSLPTFGVFEAYAGAYSKDSSQQSIGEISYTIPFFTGRLSPGPSVSRVGIEDVYQAGDEARIAIEEAFTELYPSPETAANSIASIGDMNNMVNNILETTRTVLPSSDLQKILRISESVRLNAAKLVRDAKTLGASIFSGTPDVPGLWQQISLGMSKDFNIGIEQLSLLTSLGGGLSLSINDVNRAVSIDPSSIDIPLWPETTKQRISRNISRKTIVHSNRVSSLVGLYEISAAHEYKTEDEIIFTRNSIESLHERIMRSETINYNLIQSKPSVRSAIENVRLASLNVLGQKEQEAFQIIFDDTGTPTSSLVRSYLLYAESLSNADQLVDRAVNIANLNTSLPSIGLVNKFKIFQV